MYNLQKDDYRRKFVYQLLFFLITTIVGIWATTYSPLADLLTPPDEKESMHAAKNTITELVESRILDRDVATRLTSHELRMAARIVDPKMLSNGFEDIGGLEETKRKIFANILVPLKNHKQFLGDDPMYPRPVRGVLFAGPSGTGKTMTARSIAKEAGVKFINVTLSDINDKWHGESERLMSAVFSLAAKIAPCIIFIDEIDGLIGERNAMDQTHVYALKTHFLSLMDGLNDRATPVMVIGCTNNAAHIDKAMRRRLPLVISFQLPTPEERFAILCKIMRNDTVEERQIIAKAAILSDGFSGSDLDNMYREACMHRMAQIMEGTRTDRRLLQADVDAGLEATARSMDAHRVNHLKINTSTEGRSVTAEKLLASLFAAAPPS